MTGQAGGDEAAATCEVVLGNVVGTFLSPALLDMFFAAKRWEFARPDAGGGGGIGEVYRQVIQQVSLPLISSSRRGKEKRHAAQHLFAFVCR